MTSTLTHTRRGLMFVLSAPSGGGKTTLARLLLESDPQLQLSISWTTRSPRPSEQHGRDYFFVDEATFAEKEREDFFFETATVFGNRYGTPKKTVEERLSKGGDVLFDLDWQGTAKLTASARKDLTSVFILPPSMKELKRRLSARGQDDVDIIENRMARAKNEISNWKHYDYVIMNDDINSALIQIQTVLQAERLRRDRQISLNETVNCLLMQDRHN